MVVIVIIAILATISIVGFTGIQQSARNTQRSSQMNTIAESLEKYFMKNGEYPNCTQMTQSSALVVSTVLPGLDPNNLTAPTVSAGTNSFQCSAPIAGDTIHFGYLYGTNNYSLQYREEGSANAPILDSRHHANTPNYNLNLVADTALCGGSVSGGGSIPALTTQPILASPTLPFCQLRPIDKPLPGNSGWDGSAGSGCNWNITNPSIYMDGPKTCTAHFTPIPLTTPATPLVTMNVNSPSYGQTTWTWGAIDCGTSTIQYQYHYFLNGVDQTPLGVITTTPSLIFTTYTEGITYLVTVQAQCYNAAPTFSDWTVVDSNSSKSYSRPSITGGTVSYSGGWTYQTFYNTGYLNVPAATIQQNMSASVLGGGGGGAGGAGGNASWNTSGAFSPLSVGSYQASVGAGGNPSTAISGAWGGAGAQSSFQGVVSGGGGGGAPGGETRSGNITTPDDTYKCGGVTFNQSFTNATCAYLNGWDSNQASNSTKANGPYMSLDGFGFALPGTSIITDFYTDIVVNQNSYGKANWLTHCGSFTDLVSGTYGAKKESHWAVTGDAGSWVACLNSWANGVTIYNASNNSPNTSTINIDYVYEKVTYNYRLPDASGANGGGNTGTGGGAALNFALGGYGGSGLVQIKYPT